MHFIKPMSHKVTITYYLINRTRQPKSMLISKGQHEAPLSFSKAKSQGHLKLKGMMQHIFMEVFPLNTWTIIKNLCRSIYVLCTFAGEFFLIFWHKYSYLNCAVLLPMCNIAYIDCVLQASTTALALFY